MYNNGQSVRMATGHVNIIMFSRDGTIAVDAESLWEPSTSNSEEKVPHMATYKTRAQDPYDRGRLLRQSWSENLHTRQSTRTAPLSFVGNGENNCSLTSQDSS